MTEYGITAKPCFPVVAWMKENGYKIDIYIHEENQDREISAIYDMVVASYCQDIFIGSAKTNNVYFNGSTFSYFIYYMLPEHIQKVMIDMEAIMDG